MNLLPWQNSLWLAEPVRLQRLAAQVASYERCYTAREVVESRREWLASAAAIGDAALASGSGRDDRAEMEGEKFVNPNGLTKQTAAPTKSIRAVKGKIGVIPIHGPVDQRSSSELMKAGGTPLDFVSAAFDNLVANPAVGAIVLHLDSPGGSSYGTEELATKIYNARAEKPIYAMVDSMAASAGYWIATAASMVICTPGGDTGSVGVYCMHVDESAAAEMDGFKVTFIQAGAYKTELSPFGPLSEEAKANLQDGVNATYGKFVSALARNRGTTADDVRANYGQGRCMSADQSLAAGMCDRILTFEQLVAKLTGPTQAASGQAKAMVLRLRQEHRKRTTCA